MFQGNIHEQKRKGATKKKLYFYKMSLFQATQKIP